MKKVFRGDPIEISADSFNTMIDAAEAYKNAGISHRHQRQAHFEQTGIVLVRNETGIPRDRFDILGIAGPIIERAENEAEYFSRPTIRGTFATSDYLGRFVVLLEPLPIGAIGHGVVSGICHARVYMHSGSDTTADIKPGDGSQLESGTGVATVLWHEAPAEYPATCWAMVRLGGGGGGGTGARWFALITIEAGLLEGQMLRLVNGAWEADGPVVEVYPMPGCTRANYLGLEFGGDNYSETEFVPVQGHLEPTGQWVISVPFTPDGFVIPDDADTGG
ncbi:MAG: hypothetical protein IT348_19360 [Candidatus Eisenbacteria bacterium]|nr:hypothetical protein [Candidatus Eisenbacteria bacterium]